MASALKLDPAIRDWVVLPLMLMVMMLGLIRHYIALLLKSEKPQETEELSLKQVLARSARLRVNGRMIAPEAYQVRKAYFMADRTGALLKEDLPGPANPMADPSKMMDPMKSQAGFVITNGIMMTFISYFFAGFVMLRVPFPLTNGFKVMLQRGVELSTLDASYVSSISWYFLVMFGMRAVLNLFLGADSAGADDARAMQAQMGMGGGAAVGFDAKKAYAAEVVNLKLSKHACDLDDAEKRLLGTKYPKPNLLDMPAMMGAIGAGAAAGAGKVKKKSKKTL